VREIIFFFAGKTHNGTIRGIFRGGRDLFDPLNCPERRDKERKGKGTGKGTGTGTGKGKGKRASERQNKSAGIIFLNRPGQTEKNPRTSEERAV
jgi:hypothetical protein